MATDPVVGPIDRVLAQHQRATFETADRCEMLAAIVTSVAVAVRPPMDGEGT